MLSRITRLWRECITWRTVARCVKPMCFVWVGIENVDFYLAHRPSIPQDHIDIVSGLLLIDHLRIVQELSVEVGLSHQTMWHIINKCLNIKILPLWIPRRHTYIQKWHRHASAGIHHDKYYNDVDAFP